MESAPELREAIAEAVYDLRFPHVSELDLLGSHSVDNLNLETKCESGPCEVTSRSSKIIEQPVQHQQSVAEGMNATRKRLRRFLYDPDSSGLAMAWSVFMLGTVIASLLMLVLVPLVSMPKNFVFGFEVYITAVFSLEIVLKLSVANSKGKGYRSFFMSVGNICDVVATLPLYLELAFAVHSTEFQLMRLNRILRVTRAFRFVKLQKTESLAGPLVTVLAVIWGIFLHVGLDYVNKDK